VGREEVVERRRKREEEKARREEEVKKRGISLWWAVEGEDDVVWLGQKKDLCVCDGDVDVVCGGVSEC
jgi:hypothetical protein